MKQSPVVHFEMPTEDKERVSKFYKNAFGWEMQIMGPEFGEYVLAMTTESNDKGPLKPGAINGGFYKKSDDPDQCITRVVISVEDLEESIKLVESEGGKIIGEKMNIPGVGLYASFADTEGNHVGMLQPTDMAGMTKE